MHFAEMRKYTIKFVLFNIFFKLPVFDIFVVQTMVIPYHTSAGMLAILGKNEFETLSRV